MKKIKYILVAILLFIIVSCTDEKTKVETTTTIQTTTTAKAKPYTIVAVGDIACSASQRASASGDECKDYEVAQLSRDLNPDRYLLLGDIQYNSGSLEEFNKTFSPLWGDMLPKSLAIPGNHEEGSGFYDFFPGIPSEGYYLASIGPAMLIALNTNDLGSEQLSWLNQAVIDANTQCVVAIGHFPRYSSGVHGDNSQLEDYYNTLHSAGVDLYVSGHDHHYERIDAPVSQIVVGTGGRSLRSAEPAENTISLVDNKYGVLLLSVYDNMIAGQFISIDNYVLDQWEIDC